MIVTGVYEGGEASVAATSIVYVRYAAIGPAPNVIRHNGIPVEVIGGHGARLLINRRRLGSHCLVIRGVYTKGHVRHSERTLSAISAHYLR